jgi:hypothetical protein
MYGRSRQTTLVAAVILVFVGFLSWSGTAPAKSLPRFCQVRSASAALGLAGHSPNLADTEEAVLLVSSKKISTGRTIYARPANFGKEAIGYGLGFTIEKHNGSGWETDPSNPGELVPAVGLILRPESAGRCYIFEVPRDHASGVYRFFTKIRPGPGGRQKARLSAAFRVEDFCDRHQKAWDYFKPLEGLPALRAFPNDGRLRVGPPALRIYPAPEERNRLVPIQGGTGTFQAHGQLERSRRQAGRLDWWVSSRLERIDRHGVSTRLVRGKSQYVGTLRGFAHRDFGFRERVTPGLYRLTIDIENSDGRKLDRYQEYFRAIPARSDLRLATNFSSLGAGEEGAIRIENFGTVSAVYGFGYELWNENGEKVPINAIFPNIALKVDAGYAGLCSTFKVPEGIPSGEYRIEVDADDALRGRVLLDALVRLG